MADYEQIGGGYATRRVADPRINAAIRAAIGPATSLLNVGAGTGNYEPVDCAVTAIEPSLTMIAQRATGLAPVVQGVAEALPFPDGTFDVAMGILTLHHWRDLDAGLDLLTHRIVNLNPGRPRHFGAPPS